MTVTNTVYTNPLQESVWKMKHQTFIQRFSLILEHRTCSHVYWFYTSPKNIQCTNIC